MKILFLILLIFSLFNLPSFAIKFTNYSYSKPVMVNQQLQMYRMNKQRQQAIRNYYSNPTRNIRYPNSYSKYPNIERNNYHQFSTDQRYSSTYYNSLR